MSDTFRTSTGLLRVNNSSTPSDNASAIYDELAFEFSSPASPQSLGLKTYLQSNFGSALLGIKHPDQMLKKCLEDGHVEHVKDTPAKGSGKVKPITPMSEMEKALAELGTKQLSTESEVLKHQQHRIDFSVYGVDEKGQEVGISNVPYRLNHNGSEVLSGKTPVSGYICLSIAPKGDYTLEYGAADQEKLTANIAGMLDTTTKVKLERLSTTIHYNDKEETPLNGLSFKAELKDGTVFEGQTDEKGQGIMCWVPSCEGSIEYCADVEASEQQEEYKQLQADLSDAFDELNQAALDDLQDQVAALPPEDNTDQETAKARAALEAEINDRLDQLRADSAAYDAQSYFTKLGEEIAAAGEGIKDGASDYLPDLGEFGVLIESLEIDTAAMFKAIAIGDVDDLEKQFQAWQERNKQGAEKASEQMATIILLLKDEKTRTLLIEAPMRFIEAAPRDQLVKHIAAQSTQVGMDVAVVSGSTAGGALLGGVGAPLAMGASIVATTARKAGKLAEKVGELLMKVAKSNQKEKAKTTEDLAPNGKGEHRTEIDPEKKEEKSTKKCPECGKPENEDCSVTRKPKKADGNNLHSNDYTAPYQEKFGLGYEKHPFYAKGHALHVHHVIPVSAVKDEGKQTNWRDLFNLYHYDINRPHNTVMLPASLQLACELRVQCHRSNHKHSLALEAKPHKALKAIEDTGDWKAIKVAEDKLRKNTDLRYVKQAKKEVEPIMRTSERGDFCHDASGKRPLTAKQQRTEFEKDMRDVSEEILGHIDTFRWSIAKDSRDYRPGSPFGCCNASDMTNKKRGQYCDVKGKHNLRLDEKGQPKGVFDGHLKLGE